MAATTRARGDTSGRMKRESPQAPTGRQPSRSTFCTRPIDPRRTVPAMPTIPNAGVAGAVVPTPAGCHPEKKWCQSADHPKMGASCPTVREGTKEEVPGTDDEHEKRDCHRQGSLSPRSQE